MNPDALKSIVTALIFGGVFVLLPIISMLINHQQKMAEIIQGKGQDNEERELLRRQIQELTLSVEDLRAEVESLKSLPQADQDLIERVR